MVKSYGSMPDSREGTSACIIDNSLYLFGGFSRDIYNDMRVLDLNKLRWRLISLPYNKPSERFNHSMIAYKNKLVLFGGAGSYIQSIKMRLNYNDIQVFDTQKECWLDPPDIEGAPRKRMSHSTSTLGCMMLVHGGFSTESRKVLDDFNLFDLKLMKWIDTKVYQDDMRIDE